MLRSSVRLTKLASIAARASRITPRFAPAFSAPTLAKSSPLYQFQSRSYSHAPELTREIVTERVFELLEGFDKVDDTKISVDANFTTDLNLDSLDIVEVVMALEEEFSISVGDEQADSIKSVKQAIDFICSQPDAV